MTKRAGGGGEIDNECARNGHNCGNYMLVQKCQFIMISKGVGLGPQYTIFRFSIFLGGGGVTTNVTIPGTDTFPRSHIIFYLALAVLRIRICSNSNYLAGSELIRIQLLVCTENVIKKLKEVFGACMKTFCFLLFS